MKKEANNKPHGKSKLTSTVGDYEVFDNWTMEIEEGRGSDNWKKARFMAVGPDGNTFMSDKEKDIEDYVTGLEIKKVESDALDV